MSDEQIWFKDQMKNPEFARLFTEEGRNLEIEYGEAGQRLAEVDDAMLNGTDHHLWPPGLTRAQAVARLVRIVEAMREAERMQAEQEIDGT